MKQSGYSGRLFPRSEIAKYVESGGFFWATGIEDTFVAEPHAKTSRVLDEYELTDHYARWESDLDLASTLGVSAARYGLPWYRVNPERSKWDWDFADKALDKLLSLGIEPIVDLVHYGTPTWMDDSFLNQDYPRHVAEYAQRVAERFKGRVFWYTPLNEPRVNAYYCGKIGAWPPHARGWKGFLGILVQLCKGIVLTSHALERVDNEIVKCHVDATDLYVAANEASSASAELRQEVVFLALDLMTGKVGSDHPLRKWIDQHGISAADIEWFQSHSCVPDVLGINLYPMFSLKTVEQTGGRTRIKMPYGSGRQLVERLGEMYWERYRLPMFVSETASVGSPVKRISWLKESTGGCENLRMRGVPVIGYTWWPMYSLVAWSYLGSALPLDKHVLHMGLWDLDPGLNRIPTPVVAEYKSVAQTRPEFAAEQAVRHVS